MPSIREVKLVCDTNIYTLLHSNSAEKKPQLNAGKQILLLHPDSLISINVCMKLQHLN